MLSVITIGLLPSLSPGLRAQTNSAPTSQSSVIRADDEALRKACAEAVEELKAARKLIAAQKDQIEVYERLLELEREITATAKRIGELSARERDELVKALNAKDREIDALKAQNAELKRQRFTLWKGIKIGILGAAAGIVIGKVL
ncbi:MAG: hypothetical protein IPN69_08185 [Acidobacteria bacterium]|nr:hypothetical protein [Acidobacteriota bacterium]